MKIKPIHLLKKEARALKKQTSCSHLSALNAVAIKSGFESWSMLLCAHSNLKPKTLFELDDYVNFNDVCILIANDKTSSAEVIKKLSRHFLKEDLRCSVIQNRSKESFMKELLFDKEAPENNEEWNQVINMASAIADSELYISELEPFIKTLIEGPSDDGISKVFKESRLILDHKSYTQSKDLLKDFAAEKDVFFKIYLVAEENYDYDMKDFNKVIKVLTDNFLEFLKPI